MMANYGTPPIALDHGAGVRVWDTDGREYLDFVGGIAVSSLGHAHPAIVAAVTEQVGRLAHTSNLATHEPGVALAERLVGLLGLPGPGVLRQQRRRGQRVRHQAVAQARPGLDPAGGRLEIVAATNSFHGRTLGALAITGNAAETRAVRAAARTGHLRRITATPTACARR